MFFGIYKTTEYSYCLKLFERGLKTPKLIKEGRQHQINANLTVHQYFINSPIRQPMAQYVPPALRVWGETGASV